jgi:hypothetical protein
LLIPKVKQEQPIALDVATVDVGLGVVHGQIIANDGVWSISKNTRATKLSGAAP